MGKPVPRAENSLWEGPWGVNERDMLWEVQYRYVEKRGQEGLCLRGGQSCRTLLGTLRTWGLILKDIRNHQTLLNHCFQYNKWFGRIQDRGRKTKGWWQLALRRREFKKETEEFVTVNRLGGSISGSGNRLTVQSKGRRKGWLPGGDC